MANKPGPRATLAAYAKSKPTSKGKVPEDLQRRIWHALARVTGS